MRGLNSREKRLLAMCGLTIFLIVNVFGIRFVAKSLSGSREKISELELEIAEQESWLFDRDMWDQRREWLDKMQPAPFESTIRAQGDLMQALQDELFERKLNIERQSLAEPVSGTFFDEVAVNLRIRGEAAKINEWLETIQDYDKFVAIKSLEIDPDRRSREPEPQAVCEITVARWAKPNTGSESAPVEPDPAEETPASTEEAPIDAAPVEIPENQRKVEVTSAPEDKEAKEVIQ